MKIIFLSLSVISILFYSINLFAEQRYKIPTENSPFLGDANASITIIEFIDYQ